MIYTYELILLNQLQTFWNNTIVPNVGTSNDLIPDIFAGLPATGSFGANWAGIGNVITKMSGGNATEDLKFLLQFPSVKAHIPCVTIEVGAEQEQEVIGSSVAESLNQTTGKWEVQKGGVFNKQYSIGVYSFSSDATLYLFSIVKYSIILIRDALSDATNFVISARPMSVDYDRLGPDAVFFRYIDLTVEGLLDTVIERYDKVVADIAVPIPVPPNFSNSI